jgi:hypothetical protein
MVYSIDCETFEMVLGKMSKLIVYSTDAAILASIKMLQKASLGSDKIRALAKLVVDKKCGKGTKIVSSGEETQGALYFIREGTVEIQTKSDTELEKGKNEYFGADIFLEASKVTAATTIAPYTVLCKSDCVIGILTVRNAAKVFDTNLLVDVQRASILVYSGHEGQRLLTDADIADLRMHAILGEGTFGQCWLVSEEKGDGKIQPYALKIQSKFELLSEGQVEAVLQEKEIMTKLHHPFIITLVKTYQDESLVYMLMQIIQGGELFSIMHKEGAGEFDDYGLPESQAKFYALGIADALAYMHMDKIAFRDLKPENVMIDSKGYPVIIDFGFAKYIATETFTLCGTPLYLPPEVILQRGHDCSYDHWSLGKCQPLSSPWYVPPLTLLLQGSSFMS